MAYHSYILPRRTTAPDGSYVPFTSAREITLIWRNSQGVSQAFLNPELHSCPPGCSPPADPSGLVVFRAWRLAAFSGSLSLYFYICIHFQVSISLWLFQLCKKSFRASMSQQDLPCWCFEFSADILTELLWFWWFHVLSNQANGAGDPGQW